MVVSYTVDGDAFRAEKPRPWSPGPIPGHGPRRSFDLHPEGKRIAIVKGEESSSQDTHDHLVFIENFFDEVRRLAPDGNR
jgi:hypothetical protein